MINKILEIYTCFFSRGYLQKINDLLLKVCLRARGYNNFRNNKESGEIYFIDKILAPTNPKICFDIGANVGNYSSELLKKTNSKVYSFEPHPTSYSILLKNLSKYGDRLIAENKGIGSENKTQTIHFNPQALDHASFSEDVKKVSYVTNDMKLDVEVVTLDSFCEKNLIKDIDFIKIDTEGFELEIFKGAKESFKKFQPKFIQIEFNWHQLFRNTTLNYFAENLPNYDVYQLIYDGWIKRDPRDPLTNIYYFSNFIFVRR
jgi:FkbM family methyltransferase